jgi:serine/threonine protein kinase
MEINIIFPNNEEPVIEYKLPDFINENKEIGDNPGDFEILQYLGHGNFSQVLKVRSKKNFEIYAMKKINITKIFKKYKKRKYYMNEVRIIEKLDHFRK